MTPRRIEQISLVFVGIMVIGSVSFFGSMQQRDSLAAAAATMYVSPAEGQYKAGSTLSVAIREDSGSTEVNSVQAALRYDPTKLAYVDTTEGTVFPFAAATSVETPGQIRIARSINAGAAKVTGDNLVATVNFYVLPVSGAGSTTISFDTAFSLIVSSGGDNANIMVSSLGGSYSIKDTAKR